ncbi:hypothetical protein FQV37_34 [Psychrobacter nivimaris]|uniref:Uncharacterized protein n=1 Tax=Psychrobacter nivimaris TaxID=281738 RepID=A0A6N7C676_9GAMM|nr:hypothetical protein FQV37_34 [Psychrobacter nivimaris]
MFAKLPYLVALQSSSIFIIDVISWHDLSVHTWSIQDKKQQH